MSLEKYIDTCFICKAQDELIRHDDGEYRGKYICLSCHSKNADRMVKKPNKEPRSYYWNMVPINGIYYQIEFDRVIYVAESEKITKIHVEAKNTNYIVELAPGNDFMRQRSKWLDFKNIKE